MSQCPTLVKTVTRTLRDGIGVYLFKLSRDLAKLLDAENDPDIDIGRREELDKSNNCRKQEGEHIHQILNNLEKTLKNIKNKEDRYWVMLKKNMRTNYIVNNKSTSMFKFTHP